MKLGAILFAAAGLSLALGAPVAAQAPNDGSTATQAEKKFDPNQIVCEKQEEVGSRLATSKICHTRAEWAEQRRQERMDVDRIQTQRGCKEGQGC